jgi:hypothetical protein
MNCTHQGIQRDSISLRWDRAHVLRMRVSKVGFPVGQEPLSSNPALGMVKLWTLEGVVAPGRGC